ncbi:hypothetical protein [Peterkaempfera griseoplana]|uniref:hypothetical protein n=1 Tax=Peterkaempfera griseoplana TaxID=66896 RepID=UPI0006E44F58|nr:hypothetical protein [Peterkaempfera griseoplana]
MDDPSRDAGTAARLIPLWLAEAAENDPRTAEAYRRAWEDGGRVLPEAAQELADWTTARVTDTGFNEDEGPIRPGPRITVADKEAVHRWLRAGGHRV